MIDILCGLYLLLAILNYLIKLNRFQHWTLLERIFIMLPLPIDYCLILAIKLCLFIGEIKKARRENETRIDNLINNVNKFVYK